MENLFPEHNLHFLCSIFTSPSQGVHHNRSRCCKYKSEIYVQVQGHMLWSRGKIIWKNLNPFLAFHITWRMLHERRCVAYRPWSQPTNKICVRGIASTSFNQMSFHCKKVSTKIRRNSNHRTTLKDDYPSIINVTFGKIPPSSL